MFSRAQGQDLAVGGRDVEAPVGGGHAVPDDRRQVAFGQFLAVGSGERQQAAMRPGHEDRIARQDQGPDALHV